MIDPFFFNVLIAGTVAGASTGFLGAYIVGMRMPFIGICISHAAMAGTVLACVLGIAPMTGAVILSAMTSMSMAVIAPGRARLDTNVGLAILFSLMLGLTFLAVGLVEDSRSEVLGMLWGSILFVRQDTLPLVIGSGVALGLFAWLFHKEMKAILFSRTIAHATGIHERLVYALFLLLCGTILSVNLKMIGGLMIFSLITNPAAAAYQICRGLRSAVLVATLFGMLSTIIGFCVSFWLDLPTGACIVLTSTAIFALAVAVRRILKRMD